MSETVGTYRARGMRGGRGEYEAYRNGGSKEEGRKGKGGGYEIDMDREL